MNESEQPDPLDRTQQSRPAERTLGILAHEGPVPADFDAPLPDDILDAFEGVQAGDLPTGNSSP